MCGHVEETTFPALDWQEVARSRAGTHLGDPLVYKAEVDSTNTLASSLLPGATAGTVVVADYQSAGRGRLRRQWIAPPGSGLTFTAILAPCNPSWVVPMAVGLGVQEAIARAGIDAVLKWPNDVLIGDRKCAGILIESKAIDGRFWLLAGIGLNVHHADPSIATATYLDAHARGRLSREDLLVSVLSALESWLGHAAAAPAEVREAWRSRLATIGRRVQVLTAAGPLNGVAEGVAEDGALILRLADGTRHAVQAGDVTLASRLPGH
jgi:BirA family biotin operon repressor/biotin-[acetyl-CoA-carboxylase] ligase